MHPLWYIHKHGDPAIISPSSVTYPLWYIHKHGDPAIISSSSVTYPLWYIHKHGGPAIISPGSVTYPLWYIHKHGSRAIVSPCSSSSKHITHSPLSSVRTSSEKIDNLFTKLIHQQNDVQNQQNDMCVQQRVRSAWASAQSDQSLRCPHEETLGP